MSPEVVRSPELTRAFTGPADGEEVFALGENTLNLLGLPVQYEYSPLRVDLQSADESEQVGFLPLHLADGQLRDEDHGVTPDTSGHRANHCRVSEGFPLGGPGAVDAG